MVRPFLYDVSCFSDPTASGNFYRTVEHLLMKQAVVRECCSPCTGQAAGFSSPRDGTRQPPSAPREPHRQTQRSRAELFIEALPSGPAPRLASDTALKGRRAGLFAEDNWCLTGSTRAIGKRNQMRNNAATELGFFPLHLMALARRRSTHHEDVGRGAA